MKQRRKGKHEVYKHMNDEQYHGCYLGFIGDENLPSYVGIIINHWEDPS